MDVNLTTEQRQTQSLARDVAQKELAPKAAQIDRTSTFPRDNLKKLAEVGLMGIGIPRDFDGSKSDTLTIVLVIEEVAKACASTAEILVMHLDACGPILAGGSDEVKKQYLASLAKGEKLGAFAISEPGSGCNPFNVEVCASTGGEYYTINGTKAFVTSCEEADVYAVVVRTNPNQPGPMGQSYLLVEKGRTGLSFGNKYDRMGLHGTSP